MNYFAHVKWFVDKNAHGVEALHISEWLAFGIITVVGLLVFSAIHVYANNKGIEVALNKKFGKYASFVPAIVRYTTGLLLVINAAHSLLFAPNVPNDVISIGPALSVLLFAAGVLLIIGIKVRWAAMIMLGVYGLSLLLIQPIIDVLDHIEYVGIGLYLLLYKDAGYLQRIKNYRRGLVYISPAALLRVFVGFGLMTLALSEKLIGITNSSVFLEIHSWNFLYLVGMSDRNFIILAGAIEFLVGLTLVLNIAPRLTTAIVALLMTMTAILLGIDEVFGHLFALSLVAIVWLNPGYEITSQKKYSLRRH